MAIERKNWSIDQIEAVWIKTIGRTQEGKDSAGAIISFGTSYVSDVISNTNDGFDWSDLNTFKDNWAKYICAGLGGAVAGGFGALSNAGLSFVGGFLGNMIENAYSYNSIENFRYSLWTSLIAGGLAGIGTAITNKLTNSYFNHKMQNASKEAFKQIKTGLKNTNKQITNKTAINILKSTSNTKSVISSIDTIMSIVLGFFY